MQSCGGKGRIDGSEESLFDPPHPKVTSMGNTSITMNWLNFPEQFLLCRNTQLIPPGWSMQAIRDWHLGHHPSLPVVRLQTRDHVPIGWLLGYAIDGDGVLLDSETVTVFRGDGVDLVPEDFESWLYELGGRFLAVLLTDSSSRVYLDPCGSLSAVYCSMREMVASTVAVIPYDGDTVELTDLVRLVGIPESSMYPLNLTPRKNVWRLLPNHFLDLRQWEAVRHWPKGEILLVGDTDQAVTQVVERVRLHMKALVAKKPVLLRLTAGQDSRVLLACARPLVKHMTFFTAEHEFLDAESWLDCNTAAHIARKFELRYIRLPHLRPRQADLDEWLLRTGWSVGEIRGWRASTTYKQLPPGHADLVGVAGGVARGLSWRPDDTERTTISPDRLLARLRAGQHPSSRSAVSAWLDLLPCRDPFLTLDLFHIEQRLGCWGGVYPYAFGQDGRFQLFPLCHRQIFATMLSLPIAFRAAELLGQRIIEREWPELLHYPINQARGLQRVSTGWRRAIRKSEMLAKRLTRAAQHPIGTARRITARWGGK